MAENESKHDKFKRLATLRVRNAIKRIELVGNLSSPGYEYTEEEAGKILSSMQETLDVVKEKFSRSRSKTTSFEL